MPVTCGFAQGGPVWAALIEQSMGYIACAQWRAQLGGTAHSGGQCLEGSPCPRRICTSLVRVCSPLLVTCVPLLTFQDRVSAGQPREGLSCSRSLVVRRSESRGG